MANRRQHTPVPYRVRFRGFSFAEVMFAVMLLGLGFIMVAAIFPVAIRQQSSSMEDSLGVPVAKRGAAMVTQMGAAIAQYDATANDGIYGNYANLSQDDPVKRFPNTASVAPSKTKPVLIRFQADPTHSGAFSLPGVAPYTYVKGDLIQGTDRRLAWIPVAYASTLGSQYATIYLCAVQSRANEQFTDGDRDKSALNTDVGPFVPVNCFFKLVEGGKLYPDTLVFTGTASDTGAPVDIAEAVEGAFVWVADDNVTNNTTGASANYHSPNPGDANGRYYRLGAKRDDMGPGVWELQPGYDMTVTINPGSDKSWSSAGDNVETNENLPPRITDAPQPLAGSASGYQSISGNAARGYLVGRGRPRVGGTAAAPTYGAPAGPAMPLFAIPSIQVRIQP